MPTTGFIATPVNFEELQKAFAITPKLSTRYAREALLRFSKRVAKRIKTEYMHGRPGIKGGPWAKVSNKNVRGFTTGKTLTDLRAVDKVSRIVRSHVEGAEIKPRHGMYLTLSIKTGIKGKGRIIARVRSVKIPARVKAIEPWMEEVPRGRAEISAALSRAMKQAISETLKSVGPHG